MSSATRSFFRWITLPWPEYILVGLAVLLWQIFDMPMKEFVVLTIMLVLQNAAFTLVSRARQSKSLSLHTLVAILSNGLFIFVLTTYAANYDDLGLKIWYIVCTTVGSVHAHHLSLKRIEETKRFKKDSLVSHSELQQAIAESEQRVLAQMNGYVGKQPLPLAEPHPS